MPDASNHYVGVGQAGRRESVEKQITASEQSALAAIAGRISVSIQQNVTDIIRSASTAGGEGMEQEVEAITKTKINKTLLRDVRFKEKWLDRKECVLYTLASVSKESVIAVQKEIEEKFRKSFLSKKVMLFSLDDTGKYTGMENRIIEKMTKVFLDMEVKMARPKARFRDCAGGGGGTAALCAELPRTIFGGFTVSHLENMDKVSANGKFRVRFYNLRGALYFKERVVASFDVRCRGVGRADEDDDAVSLYAADGCVKKIRKRLRKDMQGSE